MAGQIILGLFSVVESPNTIPLGRYGLWWKLKTLFIFFNSVYFSIFAFNMKFHIIDKRGNCIVLCFL